MKSIITTSLLGASLAIALVLPSKAIDISASTSNIGRSQYTSVKPFNLVYLGYQGYFENQGISSNGAFINDVHSGKINAQKLVEVAIATGRLPQETLNDQEYLWKVQSQLDQLEID